MDVEDNLLPDNQLRKRAAFDFKTALLHKRVTFRYLSSTD